ncbi:unnamed protein product [Heterobilharzia americana]|nr:unnamed protein product [Heterobilharzia americana]
MSVTDPPIVIFPDDNAHDADDDHCTEQLSTHKFISQEYQTFDLNVHSTSHNDRHTVHINHGDDESGDNNQYEQTISDVQVNLSNDNNNNARNIEICSPSNYQLPVITADYNCPVNKSFTCVENDPNQNESSHHPITIDSDEHLGCNTVWDNDNNNNNNYRILSELKLSDDLLRWIVFIRFTSLASDIHLSMESEDEFILLPNHKSRIISKSFDECISNSIPKYISSLHSEDIHSQDVYDPSFTNYLTSNFDDYPKLNLPIRPDRCVDKLELYLTLQLTEWMKRMDYNNHFNENERSRTEQNSVNYLLEAENQFDGINIQFLQEQMASLKVDISLLSCAAALGYSELILSLLQWAVRSYCNQSISFFIDHDNTVNSKFDVENELFRSLSLLHDLTPDDSISHTQPGLTPLGFAILHEQLITTQFLVIWDRDTLHRPCFYASFSSPSKVTSEFTPKDLALAIKSEVMYNCIEQLEKEYFSNSYNYKINTPVIRLEQLLNYAESLSSLNCSLNLHNSHSIDLKENNLISKKLTPIELNLSQFFTDSKETNEKIVEHSINNRLHNCLSVQNNFSLSYNSKQFNMLFYHQDYDMLKLTRGRDELLKNNEYTDNHRLYSTQNKAYYYSNTLNSNVTDEKLDHKNVYTWCKQSHHHHHHHDHFDHGPLYASITNLMKADHSQMFCLADRIIEAMPRRIINLSNEECDGMSKCKDDGDIGENFHHTSSIQYSNSALSESIVFNRVPVDQQPSHSILHYGPSLSTSNTTYSMLNTNTTHLMSTNKQPIKIIPNINNHNHQTKSIGSFNSLPSKRPYPIKYYTSYDNFTYHHRLKNALLSFHKPLNRRKVQLSSIKQFKSNFNTLNNCDDHDDAGDDDDDEISFESSFNEPEDITSNSIFNPSFSSNSCISSELNGISSHESDYDYWYNNDNKCYGRSLSEFNLNSPPPSTAQIAEHFNAELPGKFIMESHLSRLTLSDMEQKRFMKQLKLYKNIIELIKSIIN